jgi:hypothetical protein
VTPIATAVKHMLASGMSHEAVVAAIAEMEKTKTTDARKERNARYYAAQREKIKTSETSETSEIKTPVSAGAERLKASESVLKRLKKEPHVGAQVVSPSLPSLRSEELNTPFTEPSVPIPPKPFSLDLKTPDVIPKSLFDEGWSAFPRRGRTRSGKDAARPIWMRAAKAVGGEAALVACIRRYAASPDALKDGGDFVPGFHRWLKAGAACNWTDDQSQEDADYGRRTSEASGFDSAGFFGSFGGDGGPEDRPRLAPRPAQPRGGRRGIVGLGEIIARNRGYLDD